ncbi:MULTISPECIES: DUF3558 domain-containing protein [unclassified Streptomyces]|uniref:DUF3558 domain-containing protein n=1 Tax=unclassified Streptomyces TaxID=2593676 RepID=UPI002DDC69A5|nr:MULTISPECIES: DUF3558 domain-containing protein [unclassified Streptomyces]WSA93129.1 DUF3558 domain-containing protein [Streptomyces sp. NBC_01795]WSB77500.1 DUF3558 domain-containing protein [Streptomyces sp. NBC_01775]WSS14235.1 DUF3558 domain-containing protein [Streptomyces sp. NBC_01186]WSS43055.1 DUF3558 domain-containing protein [Streptomyces sp. NBC_01187]
MHRNAPRNAPRRSKTVRNSLACAAVALPVLLVAGCSSDSDQGKESDSPSASASKSAPKAAPAKFKTLPDSCKSLSKGTVKDVVPKTGNTSGKRVGSGDTNESNSCLWSGLNKYDYRQLTVSLKRFDSDASLGSGDKRAGEYVKQQAGEVVNNKDNKKPKNSAVSGVGQQGAAVSYETEKKDSKGKAEDYRAERLVARSANAVVTVDYEGAGFEDGKKPSAEDLKKKAVKAAKEALTHLK